MLKKTLIIAIFFCILQCYKKQMAEIEKCKDCQYRYQCISNSNIKEIEAKYSKIDSCNFDPYQNVWN